MDLWHEADSAGDDSAGLVTEEDGRIQRGANRCSEKIQEKIGVPDQVRRSF